MSITDTEERDRASPVKGQTRTDSTWLRSALRHVRWLLGLSIGLAGARSLVSIGMVHITKLLVEEATAGTLTVRSATIGVIAFLVGLSTFISFVDSRMSSVIYARVNCRIREALLDHTLGMPLRELHTRGTADLVTLMHNDVEQVSSFVRSIPRLMYCVLIALCSVGYAATLSGVAAIVTALYMVIVTVFAYRRNRPVANLNVRYQETMGRVNQVVGESVIGIDEVKAFGLQGHFGNVLRERLDRAVAINRKMIYRFASSVAMGNAVHGVLILCCVSVFGYQSFHLALPVSGMVAFLHLLLMLIDPCRGIPGFVFSFQKVRGTVARIDSVMTIPEEGPSHEERSSCAAPTDGDAVVFDRVCFAYDADFALHDISFRLPQSGTMAIVGRTGSGKSTIAHLVAGLYAPSEGSIRILDRTINPEDPVSTSHERVSYVVQNPFFFTGTVEENIRVGKPEATDGEIRAATETAQAAAFIERLPQGFNTALGPRGVTLSGGEKQRIALARGVLRNAPILLFDEPTSSLDGHAQDEFRHALQKRHPHQSLIVISHRINAVCDFDHIILLDDGRIAAQGTHAELLRSSSLYLDMYTKQNGEVSVDA
ncbi:ABC transporter ATP-binding protein [Candidatus Hydrogenedentota bacterium]